jgi:hypothetical protein
MHGPNLGHFPRTKAGNLANDALTSRVLIEMRRPAALRTSCPHGNACARKCSICAAEYEAQMGYYGRRL